LHKGVVPSSKATNNENGEECVDLTDAIVELTEPRVNTSKGIPRRCDLKGRD
jgi:hypothetical protein